MIIKEYYSLPYISNSTLMWFKKSPLFCYKRMNNEVRDLDASYVDFGKQVHMAILEPEEFDNNYTVLEFNKPTSKQQLEFCNNYVNLLGSGFDPDTAGEQAYQVGYAHVTAKRTKENSERLRKEFNDYINYLLLRDKYKDVLNGNKFNLIQTIKTTLFNHKKASELFSMQTTNNIEVCNELPIV